MNWRRAIAVTVLQLLIVSSLGAKLLYDRATRPRVWVRTMGYDPDLPIRGRYAAMRLVVYAPWLHPDEHNVFGGRPARLQSCEQGLCAISDPDGSSNVQTWPPTWRMANAEQRDRALNHYTTLLADPVVFFLPEHAKDPTRRHDGVEIWAEVTMPKSGPPRPLQLGLKTGNGPIVPLDVR